MAELLPQTTSIQGAQIAVKLGFKCVQGRLANLLLFIDHYFNAHKSHLS